MNGVLSKSLTKWNQAVLLSCASTN
jgi:hypothetical protein